jgi:tripartite-type tricarboxylate transporter receptor subunit TctC
MRPPATPSRRAVLAGGLGLLAAPAMSPAARAQEVFPNRGIRIIVPYAPGGLPDTVARIVTQRLQTRLGQSVIVENRPGGNGNVAAGVLATSPPDGYTLMITDGSMIAINPLLFARLAYDPKRDFLPVAMIAKAPLFLAVHPSVPAKTMAEFVAFVRARAGTLNYGSSGIGSTHHLTMEAVKASLGLDITHVPFRGSGQSVPALIGGQVEMLFSAYPSLAGFLREGRVRILATNGATRSALAPDVPPLADLIPGLDFAPTIGLLAPAGTPEGVVLRLAREVAEVARMPEVVQALSVAGIDSTPLGPAEYARALDEEGVRARDVVTRLGLRPE